MRRAPRTVRSPERPYQGQVPAVLQLVSMSHTRSVRGGGELWTCPKCGRKFVGRNMWHACGDYSVERFLAPAKTRIAFMARVRFAGVDAISDRGMTIVFALPGPMRHRRIRRVENIAPGWVRTLDEDHLTG